MSKIINILKEKKSIPLDQFINISLYDKESGYYMKKNPFGKASALPWAVIFPNGGNMARHPSQIYEAILEGVILFVLINFLAFKKQLILKTGSISGFFLILYSIARIVGESFREPDVHLGYFFNYFSMGTILSAITFLCGCLIIFFIKNNEQNN